MTLLVTRSFLEHINMHKFKKNIAVFAPYDEYEFEAKLNSEHWRLLKVWLRSCESSFLITTHLEATE